MVLKRLFKDKPSDSEASHLEVVDPLIRQLALRVRGSFDLDELLQLVAQSIGEHMRVHHCMVYLCDPNSDALRWRAGYQEPESVPLRWPLKELEFPDLFQRLRRGEMVRVDDPLNDHIVMAERARFEAAGIRSLTFVPCCSDQLEAVIVIGHAAPLHQWSQAEKHFLETVAAEVAIAVRLVNLSSEVRRAGNQVYSATAEMQAENQHLQGLIQLLLLPSGELSQVLSHITESLATLYQVKACSIEEFQDGQTETATVRSMRMSDYTTDLGVFATEGTVRMPVIESKQHQVIYKAADTYPDDRFLRDNNFNFYVGIPILNRTGELIGLLNLYNSEPVTLQKRDLKTLSSIARRIGFELEDEVAVRKRQEAEHELKWRLEAATQWEEQMKFLQQARDLLRQSANLSEGLQLLIVEANQRMGSEFAAIALYDEEGRTAELFTAGIEDSVREAIGSMPTHRGVLGLLAEWSGPLRLDNIATHPRFSGFPANHPRMRTFLGVPLRVRGATVGALYFADKHNGQLFTNEDELFATELAAQVALAVAAPIMTIPERTTQWSEAASGEPQADIPRTTTPPAPAPESRIETDWHLISELFTLIERGAPIEKICEEAAARLTEFFPGSAVGVWLIDPLTQTLIQTCGQGAPIERLARRGPIRLGEGTIGRAVISGQSLSFTDFYQSKNIPDDIKALTSPDELYNSMLVMPLRTRDKTVGALIIFATERATTEPSAQSFVSVIAYCLGSVVDQSRMRETIVQHSQEMAKMQSAIESMSEPSSLGKMCDEIINNLTRSLDATHCAFFLRQSAERDLWLFRHQGLSEALAGLGRRISIDDAENSVASLAAREILIESEIEKSHHIRNRELLDVLRAESLRSGVLLPLVARDELIGLLVFASPEANHFAHYSREFFAILCNRIAGTLDQLLHTESTAEARRQPASVADRTTTDLSEILINNLHSGVMALDRDGAVTMFNPAMERLTGYRQHDVIGRQIGDIEASLFTRTNPFSDAMIQGRVINWDELQIVTKGGNKKHVSVTVSPLADERGALSGAIGIFTDMSEIRALEHERYRLTPLALIGEMSARLAHEIKNPLASMMSGLELLKRRLQYGEREARYFDRLIAELQRLDTTVREMLAYSRTTPPTLTAVDPVEPLERALDTLTPQLEASLIQVQRDYQPGTTPTMMDPNQMEQVFLNLIINAIHAMPDGGTLAASLRTVSASDNGDTISGEAPGTFIEYSIRDTGVGIGPDILDKIFDPFFSTKTHGTGLGLASVQKIIEAHHGQISVESQPSRGTTFTIRLRQEPIQETNK